jgi:hypothetical protein
MAVLASVAYARQDAPRPALARTVGVLRPIPFSHKFCAWYVRDTRLGAVPTGEVRCTWYRTPSAARRSERDELYYHVASRNLQYAERSWEPVNREAWLRDLDSVRTALKQEGGVLSCEQRSRHTPREVLEYWGFPEFEVMLFSGELEQPPALPTLGTRWSLFLRGVPDRHRRCRG